MANEQTPTNQIAPEQKEVQEKKLSDRLKGLDTLLVKISEKLTVVDNRLIKYKFYKDIPIVMRRFLVMFVIAFGAFFLLIVVTGIVFQILNRPKAPVVLPTPKPIEKVTPPPREGRNPSNYAQDEEILVLEEEIKQVAEEVKKLKVDTPTLYPPNLNYEVEF